MLVLDILSVWLNRLSRLFPTTSLRVPDTGHCRDVHLLMRCSYDFWVYGGVWPAVVTHLIDAANCVVVWLFVFVLAFVVDWEAVASCKDAEHCGPLFQRPSFAHTPGDHTLFAVIFLCAATAAFLIELSRCVESYYLLSEVHHLMSDVVDCGFITPFHSLTSFWYQYREGYAAVRLEAVGTTSAAGVDPTRMSAGDNDEGADGEGTASSSSSLLLADHSWNSFLHKLCEVVRRDRTLGIVDKRSFDELRAIQILMVYDNFLISMHHHRVFQGCALQYVDDSILKFLLASLFDDYNAFDPGRDQHEVIQKKLFWYLVAYWSLYPFLISFFLVKLIVRNVALMKTKPSEYAERQWSPEAVWRFRLLNEVVHVVAERCREAQALATEMSQRVQRPSEGFRFLERIASTVVLTVILMSAVNTSTLTNGFAWGRSLVWWLSTAVIIHSVVHRPDPSSSGGRANAAHRCEYFHEADLTKLIHLLHYDEPEWFTSASRWATTLQWDYFHSRAYLLLAAVGRTLFMPLILLRVYFDDSLPRMISFLQQRSSRVNGVGTMAVDADFRMEGAENVTPRGERNRAADAASAAFWLSGGGAGGAAHANRQYHRGGEDDDDAMGDEDEVEMQNMAHPTTTTTTTVPAAAVADDPTTTTMMTMMLEMKKVKSIASFAAVYPQWRRKAVADDSLGIATFLSTLEFGGTSAGTATGSFSTNPHLQRDDTTAMRRTTPQSSPGLGPSPPSAVAGRGGGIVPPLNLKNASSGPSSSSSTTTPGVLPPPPPSRRATANEAQHRTVARLDDLLLASRRFLSESQHQNLQRSGGGRSQPPPVRSHRHVGGRYGGVHEAEGEEEEGNGRASGLYEDH